MDPEQAAMKLAGAGAQLTNTIQSIIGNHSAEEVHFLLVFDEAHVLVETKQSFEADKTDQPLNRSPFQALDHVLTWLKQCPIFVVFMSTNTRHEQLAPSTDRHPSWRDGMGWHLFPPLTEFAPMDLHMDEYFATPSSERNLTLVDVCAPHLITRLGRPQCVVAKHIKHMANVIAGGLLCMRAPTLTHPMKPVSKSSLILRCRSSHTRRTSLQLQIRSKNRGWRGSAGLLSSNLTSTLRKRL
jgi:hypothetical protein